MANAQSSALGKRSAVELSDLLVRREVSAVELVDDFLESYERLNPQLNAIVAIDPQVAYSQARDSDSRTARGQRLGPLDGIPVTVKDNIFLAGFRATWGSKLYADFTPQATMLELLGCVLMARICLQRLTPQNLLWRRTPITYYLAQLEIRGTCNLHQAAQAVGQYQPWRLD